MVPMLSQLVQVKAVGTVMVAVKAPTSVPPVPVIVHWPAVMNGAALPGTPGMPVEDESTAPYAVAPVERGTSLLPPGPLHVRLGPASRPFGTTGTALVGGVVEY